tara:strand:- start:5 stop:127 length:123 start_codon:yes stop_codon:yes gene_type:complete
MQVYAHQAGKWCLLKPIPIELDEDDDEAQVNEPPAKRACA